VGVAVTVELLGGSYDAGSVAQRGAEAEWPPHPARLFCALVSVARAEPELAVLRWLEQQAPPVVCAAELVDAPARASWVPTNKRSADGGSQTHPGRTNQLRIRSRAVPASSMVRVVWETAEPDETQVAVLDELARRVPYLGRSTGVALLSVAATGPVMAGEGPAAGEVYEPCELDDAETTLRVPFAGYLDRLEELHRDDRPAWEVFRLRGYRRRRPVEPVAGLGLVASAYRDLVVLGLPWKPDGRLAPMFAEALRSAVLRRAGHGAPAVLHGHGVDGRPHVAFLALPSVGGQHSDGHLLGLAVAVPELPIADRKAVLAAVLGGPAIGEAGGGLEVTVSGIGAVELTYQPAGARGAWGASAERWRHGSRRWATATPMVLDRYPKREEQVPGLVAESCLRLGLPEPVDVQVSREPLMAGAVRMVPGDLPKQARGRLFRHVGLTFDQPVAGPVLLGAGRYLGVGLFAPVPAGGEGR
jgi:CRISPR-associated protein Csb2